MPEKTAHHILIFEPRLEGHHISWLRYVSEDFLSARFKVSWAVDYRTRGREIIQKHLRPWMPFVTPLSLFDESGALRGGSKINALAECCTDSGADSVFVNCFDEIASNTLRLAALGTNPPIILKGRIGGVYLRPRFLANALYPPGNLIKAFGFRRLCQQGWFRYIFLTDRSLLSSVTSPYQKPILYGLPDPWSGDFSQDKKHARQALGISPEAFVFLHYGVGDRRKGLHLAIHAMSNLPSESRLLLLCAGHITHQGNIKRDLQRLMRRKRAHLLDRYVSDAEEALCFCAADVVLLPYIKHFGSSGVLSRAAAAGKMVIASDEGLVAHLVRTHRLGWLFRSGRAEVLKEAMIKASSLSEDDRTNFSRSALQYAETCSRQAFRNALLVPFRSG